MALSPTERLALHNAIGEHLDAILALFKPGAKITVVVRNPGRGDAGVVIGDDDLSEAIEEIRRRMPPQRD